jgi:hypothetical protein
MMIDGSRAAFNAQTDNKTNLIASGNVVLSDDDSGTKMFNLSGLNGGQTVTRCLNVTYSGTLTSDIKLYGVVGGTGLAAGLTTNIEVGTGATGGTGFSCTAFTAASTVFGNKTLAQFGTDHGTYGTGLGGFDAATATTTKSYRITVTVANNNIYQDKTATFDLTWEAQGRDGSTANAA